MWQLSGIFGDIWLSVFNSISLKNSNSRHSSWARNQNRQKPFSTVDGYTRFRVRYQRFLICNHTTNDLLSGGEAIDWAVEISLCERCAERKNGNYHAWNHRQWVLQKAPNLLNYEIVKTERFIRKNIADYSCYHHRHFVLMKLFDQQYFDIHDSENVDELYQFVNSGDLAIVSNVRELARYLLPNVEIDKVNVNKLKSFLFSLNLAIYDLRMIEKMLEMHGKYEAFKCYKRIVVEFAIEIMRLANCTDYLKFEIFTKPSAMTGDDAAQSEIVSRLAQQVDDDEFKRIFF